MANRITGKDVYITLTGDYATGRHDAFVGEVDSFTADYSAEHTDTRPVYSQAPYHQMTGSTWHVTLQGGVTDALYFWLAADQDQHYKQGLQLPQWTLQITGTNPTSKRQTINCTFMNGMVYTANIAIGKANELLTQQLEMYFDDADIVTAL